VENIVENTSLYLSSIKSRDFSGFLSPRRPETAEF
jgi:hypothetical protein